MQNFSSLSCTTALLLLSRLVRLHWGRPPKPQSRVLLIGGTSTTELGVLA